jgi:hypothetical protein
MSGVSGAGVTCLACGAMLDVRIADSVSTERTPEARGCVLDRTLFQAPCACGRLVSAPHPLLYVDFEHGLWVQVLPEDERPRYHGHEAEVAAAYRTAFDTRQFPRFVAVLGQMVRPRLVFGHEELREKVVGAGAGLDDGVVEVAKLELLAGHSELLRQGVMLLTLDAVDARGLGFRAYRFAPGEPGEILGEVVAPRTLYDGLAARRDQLRDAYPSLFDAVYVNVQRYRFEPG